MVPRNNSLEFSAREHSGGIQPWKKQARCTERLYRLPRWLSGKESACNAGYAGEAVSIPGSGRSPGGGNGSPLQYSCLGNPIQRNPRQLQSMGLQRVGHNLLTQHVEIIQCCIFREFKKLVQGYLCQYVDFIVPADARTCLVTSPQGKGWGE